MTSRLADSQRCREDSRAFDPGQAVLAKRSGGQDPPPAQQQRSVSVPAPGQARNTTFRAASKHHDADEHAAATIKAVASGSGPPRAQSQLSARVEPGVMLDASLCRGLRARAWQELR